MNLVEHLNPIEDVARDLARYAHCIINAENKAESVPRDVDLQRELFISMFTQLEVLKLRCTTLQKSKAFKELGT